MTASIYKEANIDTSNTYTHIDDHSLLKRGKFDTSKTYIRDRLLLKRGKLDSPYTHIPDRYKLSYF